MKYLVSIIFKKKKDPWEHEFFLIVPDDVIMSDGEGTKTYIQCQNASNYAKELIAKREGHLKMADKPEDIRFRTYCVGEIGYNLEH